METFLNLRTKNEAKWLWWVTVIKAPANEYRPHIITVLIRDQWVVKTDGSRIHAVLLDRPKPVPDGCYHVIKRSKRKMILVRDPDMDVKKVWPDWIKVFPKHEEHRDDHYGDLNSLIFAIMHDAEIRVNTNFIHDLFKIRYDYFFWYRYQNDADNKLVFANENRLAIIMPMRIP
jgi:hypothetical protein